MGLKVCPPQDKRPVVLPMVDLCFSLPPTEALVQLGVNVLFRTLKNLQKKGKKKKKEKKKIDSARVAGRKKRSNKTGLHRVD
jgi:hypothetical protein